MRFLTLERLLCSLTVGGVCSVWPARRKQVEADLRTARAEAETCRRKVEEAIDAPYDRTTPHPTGPAPCNGHARKRDADSF